MTQIFYLLGRKFKAESAGVLADSLDAIFRLAPVQEQLTHILEQNIRFYDVPIEKHFAVEGTTFSCYLFFFFALSCVVGKGDWDSADETADGDSATAALDRNEYPTTRYE